MPTFLTFTIRSPMQSWGDDSVLGEDKLTLDHPTRSGVLGLVAACLGIKREENDRLLNLHHSLGVAVRKHKNALVMNDFHTTLVNSKLTDTTRRNEVLDQKNPLHTIVSHRHYLMDTMFTICIWNNGYEGFDLLQQALLYPKFFPYLGRKTCPLSYPFLPQYIESANVLEAIQKYEEDRMALETSPFDPYEIPSPLFEIWSDSCGHGLLQKPTKIKNVRDLLVDKERHAFSLREEHFFKFECKEGEVVDYVH